MRLRGGRYGFAWELPTLEFSADIDADFIGYHWVLRVTGWGGQTVAIAQGRCFDANDALRCVQSYTQAYRWMLERKANPPSAIKVELNIRQRLCDFFRIA